jgi:hypothetical protein
MATRFLRVETPEVLTTISREAGVPCAGSLNRSTSDLLVPPPLSSHLSKGSWERLIAERLRRVSSELWLRTSRMLKKRMDHSTGILRFAIKIGAFLSSTKNGATGYSGVSSFVSIEWCSRTVFTLIVRCGSRSTKSEADRDDAVRTRSSTSRFEPARSARQSRL